MPTNYFNGGRPEVKNEHPGHSQIVYVAPVRWFDTIADVVGTMGADAVSITDDHTFIAAGVNKEPGGGFIELYCTPNTVQSSGANSGDAGSLVAVYKKQMFLPGDAPEMQQMLEKLKNEDLIVLLQDPISGKYTQYGNAIVQSHFDKCDPVSGGLNSGKKGWNLELSSPNRYFYNGAVTVMA